MWTSRNPMGGIWLTKSPNGTRIAPFRPGRSARMADPVDDDAGEAQDRSDEDDEMGGVLPEAESARRGRGSEGVLGQVEDEPEGDGHGAELGQAGDRPAFAGGGLRNLHDASRGSLSLTSAIFIREMTTCQLFDQRKRAIECPA